MLPDMLHPKGDRIAVLRCNKNLLAQGRLGQLLNGCVPFPLLRTCIQCVQGWLRRSPGGPLAWHPVVLWCRGGHLASLHGMLWLQPPMC